MSLITIDHKISPELKKIEPDAIGSFGQLFFHEQIVYWRVNSIGNNVLDIAVIRKVISAINKITQNNKTPLLIDISDPDHIPSFTPTARAAMLGPDFIKSRTSIAFLINSITQRTIYYHIYSSNRINVPLKAFQIEEEAKNWLHTFLGN